MQASVQLPKAFSVRDEHEFFPIEHLLKRLNPKLAIRQVATGKHVDGGCTVYWGLVYVEDRLPGNAEMQTALTEAGFDFSRNGSTPTLPPSPAGKGSA